MALLLYVTVTVVGALVALLYPPLKQQAIVMGLTRPLASWENVHGLENRVIEDTVACEDLHYHEPSGMLYLGCIGDLVKASGWFPGADALEHPENPGYGTLVVVDTKTLKPQKLELVGFEGPFVPHGISLYSPPSAPKTVYIFSVNHVPNLSWTPGSKTETKTASRIELFVHTVGGKTATHLRSISHPLIWTPNDIVALSEREFLVTNDHRYLEGPWRLIEEAARVIMKGWTNLAHVILEDSGVVNATVALDSIPTNNGLGWGPGGPGGPQVLISDATGGGLYFAGLPDRETRRVSVSHRVQTGSVVDNPSFFADPYAAASVGSDVNGTDYSGYVLAGVGRAVDFVASYKDPAARTPMPSIVYYLPASAGLDGGVGVGGRRRLEEQVRLLFSDDGASARSATTAVVVAIDPRENSGRREGWLFVTGVVAPHLLATKIDFEKALG